MTAFLRTLPGALTALCGLALLISFIPGMGVAAYLAVAFGSYGALRAAYESIQAREIDVNLLMVLAACGAIAVGRAEDAGVLLFLFSLSGALEEMAMARTRNAIEGLVRLRPSEAIRIVEGREERVAIEALTLGDRIRIPPFEAIPVDGAVIEGGSAIDASAMTGESHEVPVAPGDRLLAGTRNLSGSFVMEVGSTVGDSTLDKIVSLVQDAQDNKASGERISEWFGQRYTFFVLFAFAASLLIRWKLGEGVGTAFYQSLTLLVALSPCALVISIPASTLSALAFAARRGILVRGGEFIERAGAIDTLALDKTGTLTVGQPRLVEICVCAPTGVGTRGCTDEEACWRGEGEMSEDARGILLAAASIEAHSPHPVALAIKAAADARGIESLAVAQERAVPGLGIAGAVNGREVRVGQLRFLREEGVETPQEFIEHALELERSGLTVALVAYGERLAALGLADVPRAEAPQFLADAKRAGVTDVVMVTGDTHETASSVASSLGIGEVRAALLPAQKTEVIRELVQRGRRVMMVGDGVNDAPALAQATIGVAMGGLGSDIALNAADVVLMHDRLDRIPLLIRLGRRTNGIIRANLFLATGVMVVLTVLSLMNRLPLPWAVLGHEGSTVLVILNGLRLLRGED
jgi:Cd2+/Zn2+-exporting ATPase